MAIQAPRKKQQTQHGAPSVPPKQEKDNQKTRVSPSVKYTPAHVEAPQTPKPQYVTGSISGTNTPTIPQPSRGQATAAGILAETNVALEKLQKHQDELEPKLSESLNQQVAAILPQLGIKNASPELVARIADNASSYSLGRLVGIQTKEQIGQVLSDSITQAIHVTPEVASQIKTTEVQTYQKVSPGMENVAQEHSAALEKTAVLANIAAVTSLPQSQDTIQFVVNDQVEQQAQMDAPLSTPQEIAALKTSVQKTVESYATSFSQKIAPMVTGDSTPTLDELNKIKDESYAQAGKQLAAKSLHDKIDTVTVIENTATLLSIKPLTVEKAAEMGLGSFVPNTMTFAKSAGLSGFGYGLALNMPEVQKRTMYSLIAYNNPKLDGTIEALTNRQQQLDQIIKTAAINTPEGFHARVEQKNNQDRLKFLTDAKTYAAKRPGPVHASLSYFSTLPPAKHARWAAAGTWNEIQAVADLPRVPFKVARSFKNDVKTLGGLRGPGRTRTNKQFFRDQVTGFVDSNKLVFKPHVILKNEVVMLRQGFGSLAFGIGGFGKFRPSSIKDSLMKAFSAEAMAKGMGVSAAKGIMTRIAKVNAALFGAFGLYFLMGLGQAAATGFAIGAGLGGTAGAIMGGYVGFQIGVALAPFTFGLSIPLFTVLGAIGGSFAGALIFGIAGGLIALGLTTGGAAMVGSGIGAGTGGAIGAVVGFNVGAGLTASLMTTLIAACIGSLVCSPLAPFLIAISPAVVWMGGFVGGIVGAYLGAIIGGIAGYFIGKAIMPIYTGITNAFDNFFSGIGNGVTGTTSAIGGLFSSTAGLASALWNGALGIGGSTLGFIGNVAGGLSSGLGALAAGAGTVAGYATFGTFGATTALAAVLTVTTGAAFLNTEKDLLKTTAGNNQYFTINKTADKNHLDNPPPNQDLTFTINLTAKDTKISNVKVTDETTVQPKSGNSFTVTTDKDNKTISPITDCQKDYNPKDTCQYTFKITVDDRFIDSTITNTVKVTATPEGQSPIQDSTSATVTVGNPPSNCPHGWPVTGYVTQGTQGHFLIGGTPSGHGDIDVEAIDIGTPTTTVYATVDATVLTTNNDGVEATPISCPGLVYIRYQHMSEVSVNQGDTIRFGQPIGKSGSAGTGPHLHYQFNRQYNRDFEMKQPYVPANVPVDCISDSGCVPPGQITSAP